MNENIYKFNTNTYYRFYPNHFDSSSYIVIELVGDNTPYEFKDVVDIDNGEVEYLDNDQIWTPNYAELGFIKPHGLKSDFPEYKL